MQSNYPAKPDDYTIGLAAEKSYKHFDFVENDVEVLVQHIDGWQVIAFRGTEAASFWETSWVDVIRDLRVVPWYDRRTGWAHSGFLKGARLLCDDHLTQTIKLKWGIPTIVTGHSLGGGMAVLAALILKSGGFNVTDLVTFGAPRAIYKGSLPKFDGINVRCYRNGHDFVTTVPRRFFGMRHPAPFSQLGSCDHKRTWSDHPLNLYLEEML